MLRDEQLPEGLKDLAFRNSVELTHARWESDVELLIAALSATSTRPRRARRLAPPAAASAAAANRHQAWVIVPLATLALGGIGYVAWDRLGPDRKGRRTLPRKELGSPRRRRPARSLTPPPASAAPALACGRGHVAVSLRSRARCRRRPLAAPRRRRRRPRRRRCRRCEENGAESGRTARRRDASIAGGCQGPGRCTAAPRPPAPAPTPAAAPKSGRDDGDRDTGAKPAQGVARLPLRLRRPPVVTAAAPAPAPEVAPTRTTAASNCWECRAPHRRSRERSSSSRK